MQHLKIEVLHLGANHPWGECLVRIVEQSVPTNKSDFGVFNGIHFMSDLCPDIDEEDNEFFMCGSESHQDDKILPCSREFVWKLRLAIEEFNGSLRPAKFSPGSVEVIE